MPNAEDLLALHLKEHGIAFKREFRFAAPRKFRFDFMIPEHKVGIEIDGGVWVRGRHTTGAGFVKDMEKLNLGVCRGYKILRFTPKQVETGEALDWILGLLESLEPCHGNPPSKGHKNCRHG